jgi:hypothetical protein
VQAALAERRVQRDHRCDRREEGLYVVEDVPGEQPRDEPRERTLEQKPRIGGHAAPRARESSGHEAIVAPRARP